MLRMHLSSRLASFSLAVTLSILHCGEVSAQLFPDPIKHTGLEGGGWARPFQPHNNVPTHWDMTTWPAGHPAQQTQHPGQVTQHPVGIPLGHPSAMTTRPIKLPFNVQISKGSGPGGQFPGGNPGMGGQFPGGNPGMGGQVPGGGPGMGGQFAGGDPGMGGQFAGGDPGMGGQFPGGDPGMGGQFPGGGPGMGGQVPGGDPGTGGQFPSGDPGMGGQVSGGDPRVATVPDGGVPAGALGVVVVNRTGSTLAIAAKFVDSQMGKWVATWNNSVAPGQAVRLGFTNNGEIYLHAVRMVGDGNVVPVLDGADSSLEALSF